MLTDWLLQPEFAGIICENVWEIIKRRETAKTQKLLVEISTKLDRDSPTEISSQLVHLQKAFTNEASEAKRRYEELMTIMTKDAERNLAPTEPHHELVGPSRSTKGNLHGGEYVDHASEIERITRDLLRPMLKAWIDEHVPAMVEKIVRAEVARHLKARDVAPSKPPEVRETLDRTARVMPTKPTSSSTSIRIDARNPDFTRNQEPTMEDILASIRNIIADERPRA